MSFVINPNLNDQGGNRSSNASIWQYPDFSKILMKPLGTRWFMESYDDLVTHSVNGTPINLICEKVFERRLVMGRSNDFAYGWEWSVALQTNINIQPWQRTNFKTSPIRIGLLAPLQWGEVIWENILWIGALCIKGYNTSTSYKNVIISYTLGLLHTDGTISELWPARSNAINLAHEQVMNNVIISSVNNGLVARKGDLIVCKLEAEWEAVWGQWAHNWYIKVGLLFGTEGWWSTVFNIWNPSNYVLAPLQISID